MSRHLTDAGAAGGDQIGNATEAALASAYVTGHVNTSPPVGRQWPMSNFLIKNASGNVGIGTSSPLGRLHVKGANAVATLETTVARGGGGNYLDFRDPTGAKGFVGFGGGDDTFYLANAMNAPTVFTTNNIERARIDANGSLIMGRTAVPGGFGAETEGSMAWQGGANSYFVINNAGANGAFYISRRSAASSLLVSFATQGTQTGTITTNGTTTTYNTTSDYRLKDQVEDLTASGEFIDALRPRKWKWKFDGSPDAGFIAHEFAEVSPSSVNGEKDATQPRTVVNEQTGEEETVEEPAYQSMQASSPEVMAHVILELQSLRTRTAELEARLAALERA